MDVQTDHVVYAFGNDQMILFDNANTQAVVTATRNANGTTWTIHADGIPDITAELVDGPQPRVNVIQAMADHSLTKLGPSGAAGEGYSTLVPHGLSELS